jgi:hypothetical protein
MKCNEYQKIRPTSSLVGLFWNIHTGTPVMAASTPNNDIWVAPASPLQRTTNSTAKKMMAHSLKLQCQAANLKINWSRLSFIFYMHGNKKYNLPDINKCIIEEKSLHLLLFFGRGPWGAHRQHTTQTGLGQAAFSEPDPYAMNAGPGAGSLTSYPH